MKLNEYPSPKVGEMWVYVYTVVIKEVWEDKIVYTWPNSNSWTHMSYHDFFRNFKRLD